MTHTLRQARGYAFERFIVNSFNQSGWTARRLGGSTTDLPDVVATSSSKQMLFSMECKSTIGDACYVPTDQLLRCHEILRMFDVYSWRYIVLALKFAKSKNSKAKKLQYWYFVVDDFNNLSNMKSIKCNRAGHLTIIPVEPKINVYMITRKFTKMNEIMRLETTDRLVSVQVRSQTS